MCSYVRNVGIVVYNDRKEVLIGKRVLGGWSLPQGDINAQEEVLTAAKRELYEEMGLEKTYKWCVLNDRYSYMIPSDGGKIQRWVMALWGGERIRFDHGPYVEFVDYEWCKPEIVVSRCVWFKKEIYQSVLCDCQRQWG